MSAKTVALSPSNQTANTWTDGTNEEQHAVELADRVQKLLERAGVRVRRADSVRPFGSSPCRIDYFEDADALVVLHTNAFDGTVRGMRIFCYQSYSSDGTLASENLRLSRSIQLSAELLNMTPAPKLYNDFAAWGELTNADKKSIPATYVETIFHDNELDVKFYYEHVDEIADAIAGGILDYLDLPEIPKPETIYRIQVGAWKDPTLAKECLEKMKRESREIADLLGNAIIVKED